MKSNAVFSINEGLIKFLQTSSSSPKTLSVVDVIQTANQSDHQISQILRTFVKQRALNFITSRVTLLVPRSRVILRVMVFPSQGPEEIRSMIQLQIGNHIPYSKEEVEIDFQILSKTPDGYSKVAVVVIPRELVMRYLKIFLDAGIPVHVITVTSIGLWLLYRQQPDLTDKFGAIIDLDTDHSEICLCNRFYWLTSREIPFGIKHMRQDGYSEIFKQWNLTQQNAGGEKLTEPVDTLYLASTSTQSSELSMELSKTQNDVTIKEILLKQSISLVKGIAWPDLMLREGVSIAPLAGIAFSSEVPRIDLMPKAVRHSQERSVYQRQVIILGIWFTAALISIGAALGVGVFKKNVQLSQLESQLRETKRQSSKVEEQLRQMNDIEGMIKNRLIFSNLAREIDRLLPPHVYLVNINISDGNILSLQGVAANSGDVNQFQKGMVESEFFSNVSLDYVNKRSAAQGEVDYFKITCTLKSVGGIK